MKKGVEKVIAPNTKAYNPTVSSKYGETGTKQPMATEKPVADLAEEYGAGVDETPAGVLSDARVAREQEGAQLRAGGEAESRARERYFASEAAMVESGRRITGQPPDFVEGLNPEKAGERVAYNFGLTQDGLKGDFAQKFGAIEDQTADLVVPPQTMRIKEPNEVMADLAAGGTGADVPTYLANLGYDGYFSNTLNALMDLRAADSKLLPNKERAVVDRILKDAIDVAREGGWTIRDMDKLRTNFRTELDLAVGKGELTPVGAGTVANKMYGALTEDFYDTLEQTVEANPDRFPDNFVDSVKVAKAEYADVQRLLETPAGKYLLRNQFKPVQTVDHILTGMTQKDITDLKMLIGDDGWTELRPALIARIFDKALRNGEWSAGRLKTTLARLNSGDKNRIRNMFGDDTAKQLSELAEYSDRFARNARFTGSDAMNDIVNSQKLATIATQLGGIMMGGPKGIAVALVGFFGRSTWTKFIASDAGRQWLLQGHSINVPMGDKIEKIAPQDIRRALAYAAAYTARTTQRAEERQEQKQNQQNYRRGAAGFGRRSFGRLTIPVE